MNRTNNNDVLELLQPQKSTVLSRSMQSTEYCVYLHGKIVEPAQWYEHYAVFKSATPDDMIRLYINSPGGDLATAMEYITHMRDCAAPIIAVIGVDCASAATAIALHADGWEVGPFSTFLVHGFSYGIGGNAASVINHATFNTKLNDKFVREIYGDFLMEEELEDVFKGVDILIDSDDLKRRLEKIADKREEDEDEEGEDDGFGK